MFDVLIPCHNDCFIAEQLSKKVIPAKEVESVHVLHNGCEGRADALPYSNKARAINEAVPQLKAEYVCIIDADLKLSPLFFDALSIEISEKHYDAGSGVIMFMNNDDLVAAEVDWFNNGGAMFVKRIILTGYPLPENCVVEDTAYGLKLEKELHPLTGVVYPAVAYTHREFSDDDIHRRIRQTIRYNVGSFQLASQHIQYYSAVVNSLAFIGRITLASLVMWVCFVYGTVLRNTGMSLLIGSIFTFFIWMMLSLLNPTHVRNMRHGVLKQLGYVLIEPLLILPAFYIWIAKKHVW